MRRFFTRAYWRRNLPRLRSPAGRSQLAINFIFRLWPRIAGPASLYRRTLTRRVRLVAVVGSLGKSTAARAVAAALGLPVRRVSERNEFTFVALGALRVRPWHRHAVVEVGIGMPGQMSLYQDMLRPDIVVVTSIATDHMKSLRTLEVTRAEKAEMLRELPARALAVLNGDDPNVLWMRSQTRARVVTCGFGEGNDIRASDVVCDWPRGTIFQVQARGQTAMARTGLIGRKFVYSALAAIAVGLEEGMALPGLLRALADLQPTHQRLAPVVLPSGAVLLRDEFKSSLHSVDAAFDTLEEVPARRKIVVLGDVTDYPGQSGDTYRRIGDRVGRIADRAVFLGDHAKTYAAAAFRAGMPRERITKAKDDLPAAIRALPPDLGAGDVVLIKGRSNQRLGRIALALQGRRIKCLIDSCPLFESVSCDHCGMLERGWPRPGAARR